MINHEDTTIQIPVAGVHPDVYALDAKTGVKILEFAGSRGNLVSGPSIGSDGAIYVGSEGKTILLIICTPWREKLGKRNGNTV